MTSAIDYNKLLLSLQMMVGCIEHFKHWRIELSFRMTSENQNNGQTFLKFKGKCCVPHWEQDSPMQQHKLRTVSVATLQKRTW